MPVKNPDADRRSIVINFRWRPSELAHLDRLADLYFRGSRSSAVEYLGYYGAMVHRYPDEASQPILEGADFDRVVVRKLYLTNLVAQQRAVVDRFELCAAKKRRFNISEPLLDFVMKLAGAAPDVQSRGAAQIPLPSGLAPVRALPAIDTSEPNSTLFRVKFNSTMFLVFDIAAQIGRTKNIQGHILDALHRFEQGLGLDRPTTTEACPVVLTPTKMGALYREQGPSLHAIAVAWAKMPRLRPAPSEMEELVGLLLRTCRLLEDHATREVATLAKQPVLSTLRQPTASPSRQDAT